MNTQLIVIPVGRARSNHAEIARQIGIDIIAGRYPEHGKLPGDAEFTAQFGVSRPVVRESVKTLVAKGLLSTKAKVGTVVRERSAWNMFDPDVLAWHLDAGIDRRFLRDLADIRLAVEPRSAALAAERRTPEALALIEAAMQEMREADPYSVAFAEADLRLHIAIANASDNPFMRSIGAVIEAALRASFLLSAPVEDVEREIAIAAHSRIVEAIAQRSPELAGAAMTDVIFNGLRRQGVDGEGAAAR